MNKKLVAGIVIVGLIAIMVASNFLLNKNGNVSAFGGGSTFLVKAEKIKRDDISSYITANGIVEEVEKGEVFLETPIKVLKILVSEGDKVSRGQKILEVDTESLVSELERLKINKKIQQLSDNSKVNSIEVDRAASALKTAERNFNDSKKAYLDNKELYSSSAISKNDLDISEKAYKQAESTLSDARLSYDTALENKKTNNNKYRENLKITNLSIADIEKKIARINESLISPIDGVVTVLNVEEGAFTNNMQSVYKVINPEILQVKAKVKEYDIKNVKVGQTVKLTGDAIEKDKSINGKVTAISPIATVNNATNGQETVVGVTITIEDKSGILKPGLNVTCDIFTVDKKGVVVVPMGMVTEDADGNKTVFIVDTGKNTMKQTTIKLGINSDMNVEVLEGLKEGDLVIVDPLPAYKDGARVKLQE